MRFKSWLKRGRMTRRESQSIINLAYIINIQFKPSQAPPHSCRHQETPIFGLFGTRPKAQIQRALLSLSSRTHRQTEEETPETPSISLLFGKYQLFHFTSPPVHLSLDVLLILTTPARNASWDEHFCTNNLGAKTLRILQNAKMSAQIILHVQNEEDYSSASSVKH